MSRHLTALVGALLFFTACTGDDARRAPIVTGELSLNLVAPEELGIEGVRLRVYRGAELVEQHEVPIAEARPLPDGAESPRFVGDIFMTLRPGDYRAVATPLDADGAAHADCAEASADAEVFEGETTEIMLTMLCGNEGTGGLDVILAVDQAPTLTDLKLIPSKFVDTCHPVAIRAEAYEPDQRGLIWKWSVEAPANARHALNGQNGGAIFAASTPGSYTILVEVADEAGQSASLSFPIHVAGGAQGPNDNIDCLIFDNDQDGTPELVDNCPGVPDPTQADRDGDAVGDVCVDGPNAPMRISYRTNDDLQPVSDFIVSANGPNANRPVARLADAAGNSADFVSNEMLVVTDDPVALGAMLDRLEGEVVRTLDGDPMVHLVEVDSFFDAPAAYLEETQRKQAPDSHGDNEVSSEEGMALLALVAREGSEHGMVVSPNFLLSGDAIAERSTQEAAAGDGPWTGDAFEFPYFRRGGDVDHGVAEAWRILMASGLARNRTRIGIIDGGFQVDPDVAAVRAIPGFGTPNNYSCSGGGACPWHGTQVASAAAGLADNGVGAAGSAGIVADPVLLSTPAPDFFAFIEFAFSDLPDFVRSGPRIINMSASGNIPAGGYIFTFGALDALTRGIRRAGALIVASAGNAGRNVDSEDCIWFFGERCWEGSVTVPCELDKVMCVGGLGWDTRAKDPGSNFGSKHGSGNSVDIYGPYTMWTTQVSAPGVVSPMAGRSSGTSFSAPFIAGCAALVWAANPRLGPNGVEDLLLDTAHTGGDARVSRWADCYEATLTAMGGDAPPFARILAPFEGAEYARGTVSVPLRAEVEDDGRVTVVWTSSRDGEIGRGAETGVFDLSVGLHTITVTVTDDAGFRVSDSVQIRVLPAAPRLTIISPAVDLRAAAGNDLLLLGTSFDPSDLEDRSLEDREVAWYLDGSDDPIARGHEAVIPGGSLDEGEHTLRFVGSNGGLAVAEEVIFQIVDDGDDLPPRPRITAPDPTVTIVADTFDAGGRFSMNTLRGEAADTEDGMLGDEHLRWFDSEGNLLGTGREVRAKFYGGIPAAITHEVTLEAEDSAGNTQVCRMSFVVDVFI